MSLALWSLLQHSEISQLNTLHHLPPLSLEPKSCVSLPVANQFEKESGCQGRGGAIEGEGKWACQSLLNKLETVEKGNFDHDVITLTTGMSLQGIFENTFLLHIHVKNLACPLSLSSEERKAGEENNKGKSAISRRPGLKKCLVVFPSQQIVDSKMTTQSMFTHRGFTMTAHSYLACCSHKENMPALTHE